MDLTFCDVAMSYQPKSSVEPTLKCLLGRQFIYLFIFFFAERFRAGKKYQNAKQATFTLLEVCAREKLLPLLFNVCLILFCWLMFLCARNLSLKKQAWNCPDSFILLYYFYVMLYYKIRWFHQDFKSENLCFLILYSVHAARILDLLLACYVLPNDEQYTFTTLKVFPSL